MGSIGLPTTHHLYPPFPDDITTAPLVSIALSKLESGDEAESQAFYDSCKNLGFFYLQLQGSDLGEKIVDEAEKLNVVMKEFYARPEEEREAFLREKIDAFFGYRKSEVKREDGGVRKTELYNVRPYASYNMRKDDFVGNYPEPLPMHPIVHQNWDLLRDYTYHCRAAIDLMITHLEKHLQLPKDAIANLHRITERSGDHVRFNQSGIQPYSEQAARQGEHTDFGTLTILMNWLGGLQIRIPDTTDWVYVKPIPGCAVVNLGDACVKFTAGILRSNIHRVVPPPPPQDGMMRHSLVYFSRPEDKVILKRLKGGLVDQQPLTEKEKEGEEEMTAQDWIWRRSVGDLKGVYTHKGGLELRANQLGGRMHADGSYQ